MYFRRRMTGRVNPLLQLAIFLLAIALIAILGYRQFTRFRGDLRPVVVASSSLPSGTKLSSQNLQVVQKRSADVPENAAYRIQDVDGLVLSGDLDKGKPVLTRGISRQKASQDLASLIPPGRVLTTLTMENLTLPARQLKRGDLVDILVSGLDGNRQRISYVAVRSAYVVGEINPSAGAVSSSDTKKGGPLGLNLSSMEPSNNKGSGGKKGILVALLPQEVLPIARIDDAGHHITLVLHSRTEQQTGRLLTVQNYKPPRTVEIITGDNQERVTVQ